MVAPTVKSVPELDVDRSADFGWLETHGDSYPDQWVAVLEGSLVAHASTRLHLEKTKGGSLVRGTLIL
jgi:hypothetical protein